MGCLMASPFALSLWILFILSVVAIVDGQQRTDEVQALTSLKNELDISYNLDYGGPNSSPNYWSTWKETDVNACDWVGVICTSNYTVAELDLSGWQLPSLASVEILSRLPDLLVLDLSGCTLQGFPDGIGSLTRLTRLDLSQNYLYSIPQNISACRSLKYLSLENSGITFAIPDLSALVNLQFLLLGGNRLVGPIPKELAAMSSLVLIDLSGNQLNGSIPSLVNSTSLVNLSLDNNQFAAFEQPFSINAPNLQHLSVAGNMLEGSIPSAITELQSLTTISLSGNRLSGNILPALTKLPNVSAINMSSNQFSGDIPSGFSTLMSNPVGFSLDLSQNRLSGSIPLDFVQLEPSYISVLINVSFNHLNGSIPTPTVSGMYGASAIVLDFSHNQLHGSVPSLLSGFWFLDLSDNLLSGDVVDVLADDQAFQPTGYYLNLRNNSLTGDLTRLTTYWANFTKLNYVYLSNNNLSWRPTDSISDPVGAAINNFGSQLKHFSVSGNNFSGTSLPVAFSNSGIPKVLEDLDLSDTQLQGVISGDVFNHTNLGSLKSLNLSNNRITGAVSESMVLFSNQASVDLSNNQLSGDLPFIASNSTLINLQYVQGNRDLCGFPLPYCGYPYPLPSQQTGITWWTVLLIAGGSVMIAVGSCVVATWRWRVYQKKHEQDADLIKALMERESVTIMPLRDLTKATNGFDETAKLGEGGFGTVYKGQLNDGTIVAIKQSKYEGSESNKEQFLNEVKILSQVNHRHLVKLLGCCMENKVALLVLEFVPNGTLQEHLQGKIGGGQALSWKQRLTIAVQTADALNYLHSAATFPIYHRDVKSANILLNDDLSAKVADFGLSKLLPVDASHVSAFALQGTMGYMDPEFWTSFQQTDKSDVYSFGVVLLELISAKPALDRGRMDEESSLVILANPQIRSGDLRELIDPALMETYSNPDGHGRESILRVGRLALKCLAMRSRARPSMNEVWIELHNVCVDLELRSPAVKENLRHIDEEEEDISQGYTDDEENESARSDDLILLSQNWSEDNWRFASPREAGSLEMTLKSARVPKFKSKSMPGA